MEDSVKNTRCGSKRTLVGRLVLFTFHTRQCLCYSLEQGLDVVPDLCARLDEHEVVLLGLFLSLLSGDFALVVQVGLVAYEDDNDIGATLTADIVDPLAGLLEGLC